MKDYVLRLFPRQLCLMCGSPRSPHGHASRAFPKGLSILMCPFCRLPLPPRERKTPMCQATPHTPKKYQRHARKTPLEFLRQFLFTATKSSRWKKKRARFTSSITTCLKYRNHQERKERRITKHSDRRKERQHSPHVYDKYCGAQSA